MNTAYESKDKVYNQQYNTRMKYGTTQTGADAISRALKCKYISSLAYKTRFHLIFRFPAWSKRNIILTVTAQSNQFLHSKAINRQFTGGNL